MRCVCEIDGTGKVKEWCWLHAGIRDERDRLQELLKRRQGEKLEWNEAYDFLRDTLVNAANERAIDLLQSRHEWKRQHALTCRAHTTTRKEADSLRGMIEGLRAEMKRRESMVIDPKNNVAMVPAGEVLDLLDVNPPETVRSQAYEVIPRDDRSGYEMEDRRWVESGRLPNKWQGGDDLLIIMRQRAQLKEEEMMRDVDRAVIEGAKAWEETARKSGFDAYYKAIRKLEAAIEAHREAGEEADPAEAVVRDMLECVETYCEHQRPGSSWKLHEEDPRAYALLQRCEAIARKHGLEVE